jgi:hypothetical protein
MNHSFTLKLPKLGLISTVSTMLACSGGAGLEIPPDPRADSTGAPNAISQRDVPAPAGLGDLLGLTIAPKVLVPAFSPSVHDYVVRCDEGANPVVVSTSLKNGGAFLVGTGSVTPITGDTPLTLQPNASLRVQAGGGEYGVRCLPPDFPDLVATVGPGLRSPGFYLTASDAADGRAPYVMVLDERGTPLFYRRGDASGVRFVDAFGPGALTFSTAIGLGDKESMGFTTLTLEPWSIAQIDAEGPDHFADPVGFARTPDHHAWLVTHERLPGAAALDCVVQRLDASGNLVWRWRASQHVDASEIVTHETVAFEGETLDDPYGCSGLDVSPMGEVLLTMRGPRAVYLVDANLDGAVRWKMGGTPAVDPETITLGMAAGEELIAPSGARFVQGSWISVYDAGGDVARAVDYVVDLNAKSVSTVRALAGADKGPGGYRAYPDGSRVVTWTKEATTVEVDASNTPALTLKVGSGSPATTAKVPLWYFDRTTLRRLIVLN